MEDQLNASSTPTVSAPLRNEPPVPVPDDHQSWLYRAEQAVGLINSERWSIPQRIALIIAIAWVPLLLLTLFANPSALHSFLIDGRVHVRTIICIPALLVGEFMITYQITEVISYLTQGSFLDEADLAYMQNLATSIGRLASAAIPQLVVLFFCILRIVVSVNTLSDMAPWLGDRTAAGLHLTAAGWYAVFVSMPLWIFFLGMTIWNWLLWIYFVFQLSRRKLQLVASHPDKLGGLGFLGLSASGFAPIALALCFSVAATWRHAIIHHGAHLADFKMHAIVLIACIAVISGGPLIVFIPRLTELRRSGIIDYGVLGQVHSTRYHNAWILKQGPQDAKSLLAPENNTLLSFGKTYDNIGAIRVFPATRNSFYPLAMAIILPGIYVASAQLPLMVILKDLLHTLK
jgi:hypothetical protein